MADSKGEYFISSDGFYFEYIKIPAGDYMKLNFRFIYDGSALVDGNWRIEFPEVEFEFTTIEPEA